MSFIGFFPKQPIEELPIDINYLPALAGRTGTVGMPVVTVPAGMTIRNQELLGTRFRFYVEGGTDGAAYDFEIIADLTIGGVVETVQDELTVLVREAQPQDRFTELEEALPLVLPFAHGCPDETALFYLRQAAAEFFQRSLSWRATLDMTSKEGVGTYYFPVPPHAVVAKLLDAWVGGGQVPVVNMEGGRAASIEAVNSAVWTMDRTTFHVRPLPGVADTAISLLVALKPSTAATTIPTSEFEHHAEAIAAGTLARLQAQKGRHWEDQKAALINRALFDNAIGDLAALATRGFGRASFGGRPCFF